MCAARRQPDLIQREITRAGIEKLVRSKPRRCRLGDRDPVREPAGTGKDPRLSLPFRETLENVLLGCPVDHGPLRDGSPRDDRPARPYAYLNCSIERLPEVREWIARLAQYIICRDLLAVSMALDYDREDGNPSKPQTLAARLRSRAKPYDKPPTQDCYVAAGQLVGLLSDLVQNVEPYSRTSLVVPMPPSSPNKAYDLPRLLAQHLATRMKRKLGTEAVRTIKPRPQLKNLTLTRKLDALEGTFTVDASAVRGQVILLVDDLYQSGASMNFVAMKLRDAGARAILGLAVEKTCRNDDNRTKS